VKPFFKILLYTDTVEQVRIFKLNYHDDVTIGVYVDRWRFES